MSVELDTRARDVRRRKATAEAHLRVLAARKAQGVKHPDHEQQVARFERMRDEAAAEMAGQR